MSGEESKVSAWRPLRPPDHARLIAENEAYRKMLDEIRGHASGREPMPSASASKDAHRNVMLALSGRLGTIEKMARTLNGGSDAE